MLSSPSTDLLDLATADAVAAFTRHLVDDAFDAANTAGQAGRDPTKLTMSGIGGCTRACAYAVAGTPPSDAPRREDARQSVLGVWIHHHLLPLMQRLIGADAVTEKPVHLRAAGLHIPGTLDLANPAGVWDLKTVKEWRLHGVLRHGTYAAHRLQVLGYALGRYQAGHPVKWVCWLYLDRSTGEVHVEVEPFTNRAALTVIERIETIRYHAQHPDQAPRDARGPGLSYACDHCPWLRRCWGDDARPGEPGAQSVLAATPAGVEEALRLYAEGAAAESAAKKDKEFAKLILAHVPNGEYGPWELGRGRPGQHLDQKRVRKDYTDRGEELPTVPTSGRLVVNPLTRVV